MATLSLLSTRHRAPIPKYLARTKKGGDRES
jgi:hypothetical protein